MKWLALWLVIALIAFLIALAPPARAYTCDTVRMFRAEIEGMSPGRRAEWIRKLGLTRKQVRQARACLRGG